MRSLLVPGWGQAYAGEPKHGVVSTILCGIGLAASIVTGVIQHNRDVDYKAYSKLGKSSGYVDEQTRIADSLNYFETYTDSSQARLQADVIYEEIQKDMYSDYESKRKAFAISAAVTGGLWVANVIDAIIMGKRAERNYQLYFSANPTTELYGATFVYNF